jgi:hypothetical protein
VRAALGQRQRPQLGGVDDRVLRRIETRTGPMRLSSTRSLSVSTTSTP